MGQGTPTSGGTRDTGNRPVEVSGRAPTDASPKKPDELFASLERELRMIASSAINSERVNHTLQPTALVNEVWLRLAQADRLSFESREAFLAFAAKVVRHILVDYARRRLAKKRGGGRSTVDLNPNDVGVDCWAAQILELEDELSQLAELHPRSARVVELRFFAGLEMEEIASQLGVTARTVRNDWATARAWLRVRLEPGGGEPSSDEGSYE